MQAAVDILLLCVKESKLYPFKRNGTYSVADETPTHYHVIFAGQELEIPKHLQLFDPLPKPTW